MQHLLWNRASTIFCKISKSVFPLLKEQKIKGRKRAASKILAPMQKDKNTAAAAWWEN